MNTCIHILNIHTINTTTLIQLCTHKYVYMYTYTGYTHKHSTTLIQCVYIGIHIRVCMDIQLIIHPQSLSWQEIKKWTFDAENFDKFIHEIATHTLNNPPLTSSSAWWLASETAWSTSLLWQIVPGSSYPRPIVVVLLVRKIEKSVASNCYSYC